MSTFNSDKRSLQNILEDSQTGQIQLPDFQRNWRWDDEHILKHYRWNITIIPCKCDNNAQERRFSSF